MKTWPSPGQPPCPTGRRLSPSLLLFPAWALGLTMGLWPTIRSGAADPSTTQPKPAASGIPPPDAWGGGGSGCRRTRLGLPLGTEVVRPDPAPIGARRGPSSATAPPAWNATRGPGDRGGGETADPCDLFPEVCALSPPELYPCAGCAGSRPSDCPPCPANLSSFTLPLEVGDGDGDGAISTVCSPAPPNVDVSLSLADPSLLTWDRRVLATLPPRPVHCPHLAWLNIGCGAGVADGGWQDPGCGLGVDDPDPDPSGSRLAVLARDDVVWLHHDLSNHRLSDDGARVPGVSVPPPPGLPPGMLAGSPEIAARPAGNRTYLLSFVGSCRRGGWYGSSRARIRLEEMFRGRGEEFIDDGYGADDASGPHRVGFFCTKAWMGSRHTTEQRSLFAASMDATFVLVPHGHGRWSYRFTESILFGAIPVVIADGLELPFGELIDWKGMVVRVGEAELEGMDGVGELLRRLPSMERAERMRRRLAEVRDRYFATASARRRGAMEAVQRRIACTAGS